MRIVPAKFGHNPSSSLDVIKGHMLLNTSHVEIFPILCIQFVLCMGYPFMK